jgi:HK97 family phage portal protein
VSLPISPERRPGRVLYATDGRDILQNSPDGWEVDQPWLWWDGPADGDGTGGPWGNPPPGARSWFGGTGTLPAMARCRALIADALAGVPFQVFRGREQLQTPTWIVDPQNLADDGRKGSTVRNVALSAVEFWSSVFVSAVELGEGIVYSPILDPEVESFGSRGCFVLNPKDVTIEDDLYLVNNTVVDAAELLVVRGRVWPGRDRGHGVWDQFAREIGFGTSIRDYAANMLGRGIPAGYLKVTAPDLEQTEADRLKRRWWEAHGGPDRRIAVLNATTDFHPLQIDPQALQLAELLRLSAWEICLVYGIPPYKLGISMGSTNTYANVESQAIEYVQDALLPWARRVESAFDAVLPWGTNLRLNLDSLRRADTKTRYDAYAVGLSNGFLTVDEVRDKENLPPLDELAQQRAADYAVRLRRMEVS